MPVPTGVKEKIIASAVHLRYFNGKKVKIEEYLAAIAVEGAKKDKTNLDFIRWDRYFSALPEVGGANLLPHLPLLTTYIKVRAMDTWSPDSITRLIVRSCGLTSFHVGPLRNLEELDISDNHIAELTGTGMEQCGRLK